MTSSQVKGPLIGIRHLQAFLIFFDIIVLYIARLNVGVSLVAMTNAETTNPNFAEYDWSVKQQSYIQSSFFWGYIFTQFPGGYLCTRFGAKLIMFGGTLGSSIAALCIPIAVSWGSWQAYCGIRAIQGVFQGVIFPCIHQHLAKWSPPTERNRLGALSHTGIELGNVLAMFISGMIAKGPLGWPGISYITALLGVLWCVAWFFFASNNATESKFITTAEREYIESSMMRTEKFHQKKIPVPWRAILTSMPLFALIAARVSGGWGLSTLQAQIPAYMNGVLQMDIKSNAFFSALPFFTEFLMAFVFLISADILIGGQYMSLTALRKTFNTLAYWTPAVTLVGIGFLDVDQKTLAIVLMTLSVGLQSGTTIGCMLNTIDLSPNHASILMGIVNTIANIVPIVSPLVVGFIVKDPSERTEWQIVFIISAVIFFVGNTIYLIWGTALLQPWDAENFLQQKKVEQHTSTDKQLNGTRLATFI